MVLLGAEWRWGAAWLAAGVAAALALQPAAAAKPVGFFGSGSGATDASNIIQRVLMDPENLPHYNFDNAGAWIEPADYRNFSVVIACRLGGAGSRPWSDDEIPVVEDYLRDGGILVLIGTAANTLGRGRNLNRIAHLIGAAYFADGTEGEILDPGHPLLEGVELDAFTPSGGGSLTRLQGTVPLVGGPEKAAIAWTPVGEGGILFIGREFFRVRQTSPEEGAAIGRILRNVFKKAGSEEMSAREDDSGWGMVPLGEPGPERADYDPPLRRELVSNRDFKELDGEPVVLAQGGEPVCVIALPAGARPEVVRAAELLRDYLGRIIGAAPEVSHENLLAFDPETGGTSLNGREFPTVVFVGPTRAAREAGLDAAELPAEGYLIQAQGGRIFILGQDRNPRGKAVNGTMHGALAFLENTLGVRWLWPGDGGTVIPRNAGASVPPFRETDFPAIAHRTLRYSSGSPGRERSGLRRLGLDEEAYDAAYRSPWLSRARLGSSLELSYGHAYGGWWNRFGEEHPEWFALQPDGTRTQNPARERLCKSNPELAERVAIEVGNQLTENPTQDAVSISPNDGSGANFFCMCQECRKLDPPNGDEVEILFVVDGVRRNLPYPSLTDRVMTFYSRIAERVAAEHPDRLLGAYAYSRYRSPPLTAPVPPNLLIGFVGITYFDEFRRDADLRRWNGWAEKAQHIFFRPNLLLEGEGLPTLYTRRMAEDLKHFYRTGLIGVDYSRITHNWSTQGLNYYVLAKLLWDPSLDPEEIIADYCRSGFGPAAPEILGYFTRLEDMTTRVAELVGLRHRAEVEGELREIEVDFDLEELPPPSRQLAIAEVYTPEKLRALRSLLHAAAEKTDDPEILERIAFLEIGLDYTELQVELFRLASEESGPEVRERGREVLARREALFQDIMRNNPFAVGVVWLLWRENVRYERAFGWEYPAAAARDT